MEKYGIRGCCLDWFKSCLSNRKLRVSSRTADTGRDLVSDIHNVSYGTPQGLVLGPLIFLIFCNDLEQHLMFLSCIQFVDDTMIYITHANLNYVRFCLEHNLATLQDWFLANKLTLNIGKSVCMLFGKHQNQELKLSIGHESIPQVRSTKFLGLWIDENLSWSDHTNKLMLKLKANTNLLWVGKRFLPKHALRLVYFAQIHSNLSYGIGIWGSLISKEQEYKLQKIQTTCIGIIDDKAEEHRILPVKKLIELEMCKLWHKNTLKLLPPRLSAVMEMDHRNISLAKSHTYNTRQKYLHNRPKSNHPRYHDSFLVKGNRVYFQLSREHLEINKIKPFVRSLKRSMLSN